MLFRLPLSVADNAAEHKSSGFRNLHFDFFGARVPDLDDGFHDVSLLDESACEQTEMIRADEFDAVNEAARTLLVCEMAVEHFRTGHRPVSPADATESERHGAKRKVRPVALHFSHGLPDERLGATVLPDWRIARVTGDASPFDNSVATDPTMSAVDTTVFRYFVLATLDNAQTTDNVSLSGFQITYLA